MKIIYPDNVTSVTADEEDAAYPDDNVLDEHPKRVWKGTSVDATLTLEVSSGSAVAVFNTNAETVSVTVQAGLYLDWGSELTWAAELVWVEYETIETLYNLSPSSVGSLWAEYPERTTTHLIIIDFTAPAGETIQAGVVRAGTVNEFRDPIYGIEEGLKDFSIVKELSNGAIYTRKRDIMRTFSMELWAQRDDDFYTFLHTVIQQIGPGALAWRLVSGNTEDAIWVVYARYDGAAPYGVHIHPTMSRINLRLVEVV